MIYLDNAATTRPLPEVVAAVRAVMEEDFGNPSSPHALGAAARRIMEDARRVVAHALGVAPESIVFTSGGTEANNLALFGAARALRRTGRRIVSTRVEHPSVLRALEALAGEGFEVKLLEVDGEGFVSPEAVEEALSPEAILLSTIHVQNEVGSVQPLEEISRVVRRHRERRRGRPFAWHVDAVQSFCRLPLRPAGLGIDLLSLSAHKVNGPKGVGALYLRPGTRLQPLLYGGEQEAGWRSGTENLPGIAGFGAAVRFWTELQRDLLAHLGGLRALLRERLSSLPGAVENSPRRGECAPHLLNFSFPGIRGEILVRALSERGIYVSSGSACASRRKERSYVLEALGRPPEVVEGAIRLSLSPFLTPGEVEEAARVVGEVVAELRFRSPLQAEGR